MESIVQTILMSSMTVAVGFAGSGCAKTVPFEDTVGTNPTITAPEKSIIPTVLVAPAVVWHNGAQPTAADGLAVNAFASNLNHPRWLLVLPNGDVLVAQTNSPPKPDDKTGIKAWVMGKVMKRAGAVTSSANQIILLRDTNHDGVADVRSVFVDGLNSPFGMALVDERLYVANTDAVVFFPYTTNVLRIEGMGTPLVDLPAGPINHHWTKNIIASRDGSKLYATVGSNSNVAENGMAAEQGRAVIWEIDRLTGEKYIFASGLRNPNGMAWDAKGSLWTVVNERDELGNNLVPDYLTSVKRGGFYGWPYSYFGTHVDTRAQPQRPDLVAQAIVPDYALGSHVAPLGLVSALGNSLPAQYAHGMFIGQHGSWNRTPRSGYNVVFVPFVNDAPKGKPMEVLSGFVDADGNAQGRPVGVAIDAQGALLVVDDVGNAIWRVTAAAKP